MAADWEAIKTEYITGHTTYQALCHKYGVGMTNLSERARREGWRALRDKHREKMVQRAAKKAEIDGAKRLSVLMDATNKAADAALRGLDDTQLHSYIITEGLGGGATETTERQFGKLDTKALRDLTGVIKDLTALMREFYNLPTPEQMEQRRIAAARLELEQKKAKQADGEADRAITVVLEGDSEKWSK